MKTTILGLRTVIYKVGNVAEAKLWYAHLFQTEPYFDEVYYVGFTIGGYELGLQPEEIPFVRSPENVIAYWGVEDIDSEYERMVILGATEHEKPQNVGGDIMVASVKDPWGNCIGLIYNPEFKLS